MSSSFLPIADVGKATRDGAAENPGDGADDVLFKHGRHSKEGDYDCSGKGYFALTARHAAL